ncbi:hypothetical protein JTE90_018428 [Oedothorax gibbosus]|uniref:Peptidase S1 domain-containing protein n=1 Tax=Oedothorax gibbosus TaxID=931172 RepID=A0AAV6UY97_9ARAC|nr:hypothetical protein JTE90_018428 [Oedothorax gibbosus]
MENIFTSALFQPHPPPCPAHRIAMMRVGMTVLFFLFMHTTTAAASARNVTKRSPERRYYDGAIYIHPPHHNHPHRDALPPPSYRSRPRFHGHNEGRSVSASRQGFSQCSGGGKCQFFLYCWLSGGTLGPSCGPLFSCCVPSGGLTSSMEVKKERGATSGGGGVVTQGRSFGPVKNDPYCGKSAVRTSRIVGGNDAYFGQFPWQAVIQVGGSRCGGALVGRRFVVTAGHCVARSQHKPRSIRVTLGDYVLHSDVESLPPEVFGAIEVRLHPNFRFTPQADRFDVAVVVLDRPAPYRDNIRPICIPRKGADFLGRTAYAAGWGALEPGSKLRPKVLQFVPVPVINNAVCETWHRKQGINIRIHDEMMCAGYEFGGRDACQGDSGGPLMMEDKNTWYLIGIVSAGYSCAKSYQPGIYHKVSSSSDWVSSAMH